MRLRGLALKLLVGALPVCEVAAVGLAFLDPDAIGAFSDPVLVGSVGALGRWSVGHRRRSLFARCPFASWRLGHEEPFLEVSLAAPVPEGSASAVKTKSP
jgi:hypothetical protein